MRLLNKHISQLLVHLLFWMLFIFVSLFLFSDYYWTENPFLQYLALLVVLVYVNNFFLLPYFVKKKLYVIYVFVFAIMSFLATLLYCYLFAQCGCTIYKCLGDYLWQSLVPLIFFSFIWILYRFIDKQDEVDAVKKEHAEMELKFLKSQINPHVLFNNLNTIYAYALEKPNETPELILMLSDNLKHVLYESHTKTISVKKEIQFIDNYIKFQSIRTEGVTHIVYKKSIDSFRYEIAPLLLITIIENAFKHSTLHGDIFITIHIEHGDLEMICENDFDKNTLIISDFKIGLQNLEKRLKLIYPNKYDLCISKNHTFKVVLKLKLK